MIGPDRKKIYRIWVFAVLFIPALIVGAQDACRRLWRYCFVVEEDRAGR